MAGIVPSASVGSVTIGGRTFTQQERKNFIFLVGYVGTATRCATLRKPNSTAGYQVTSGKTFVWDAIIVNCVTNTITGALPGYGDTDVGMDSAALPTNFVGQAGLSTTGHMAVINSSTAAGNAQFGDQAQSIVGFTTPAGKYPAAVSVGANTTITVIGHEE